MDDPVINKGIGYHDPDGYSDNYYYGNDNYNISGYGGTQFLIDSKLYYILIGFMLYVSICCLRNRRSIHDSDLQVSIIEKRDASKIIAKIKKNIVSIEDINKTVTCSICLEEFNSEKDISFLDCEHIYHTDCIIEWINKEPTCPLCRNNELV
jgi:hypothetical protein